MYEPLTSGEEEEEKRESQRRDATYMAAGFSATESAQQALQEIAETFAKPDTYTGNRSLFDSGAAKKKLKIETFADGATVKDPYTGKTLVLTRAKAKALFGEHWQEHLAESDHIVSLEHIFKKWGSNPWLQTSDIKASGNSASNLEVVSRKANNAKRSRTNEEFVTDSDYLQKTGVHLSESSKKQAIERGKQAERAVDFDLATKTVKNIAQTGHQAGMSGAVNSGGTTLTMSGAMNIVAVIKGEKDAEEAIADTMRDGGTAAVTGYAMSSGLTVVGHTLSNASSPFLQALAKSNVPGKVITAVSVIGNTLSRYANGEITTKECMWELSQKGANLLATGYSMTVGQALIPIPIVGAAIGALVGSVLTNGICQNLQDQLQRKELEHQQRLRMIAEYELAAKRAREFREKLEIYLDNYFESYRSCFDEALTTIGTAFQRGDADGMIAGANQITRKLGGKVAFETVSEFRDFLQDDSVDLW